MVYWELMGCVRAVKLLFVYVHVCIDLHQDPTKSEPSSWGQSDGVTSVSYQLLWHWIHSVVGDSTSGTQSLDFSGEMCKKKNIYISLQLITLLFYIPLQGGPGNPAQKELTCLFNSIASFYHPSNHGRWQVSLFLSLACKHAHTMWNSIFGSSFDLSPVIQDLAGSPYAAD